MEINEGHNFVITEITEALDLYSPEITNKKLIVKMYPQIPG